MMKGTPMDVKNTTGEDRFLSATGTWVAGGAAVTVDDTVGESLLEQGWKKSRTKSSPTTAPDPDPPTPEADTADPLED